MPKKSKQGVKCEWFCLDVVKRATIKYCMTRVLLMSTHAGADGQLQLS